MAAKTVSANVVREWAKGRTIEGLPEGHKVAVQGRLHPAIREAFNAAHKGKAKYVVGHKTPKTVKVTAMTVASNGRKRPITKAVNIAEARAAAVEAGVPNVGERGRLTQPVLTAFVLGDFTGLLPTEAPASE
jgi:hypothetical protein